MTEGLRLGSRGSAVALCNCSRKSRQSQTVFAAKHIPGLDGLRAVAVFVVVLSHFFVQHWLPDGQFGVLLFFVLSGFLITLLLLKELSTTATILIKDFYLRRAKRILPAFYVSSALAIALGALRGIGFHWKELIAASLFCSNYFYIFTGQGTDKVLGVTWSLSVEEQFYIIWPGLLYLCRRKLHRLAMCLSVCVVGIWLYRALLWYCFTVSPWYLLYSFETRADALLIGALGALSIHLGSSWWRHVASVPAMIVTGFILAVLAVANNSLGMRWGSGPGLTFGAIISIILIVQSIVIAPNWLASRPMVWLGKLSYSIYLFHTQALATAELLLPNSKLRILIPAAIIITLSMATASYYAIEQPFRRRWAKARALQEGEKVNSSDHEKFGNPRGLSGSGMNEVPSLI